MDETIGVKGGYNDRRRMLKISREQKKKLRELQEKKELRELEKKVRKQQIFTLIKTLPIAIGGGTIKTLYDVGTGKKEVDKQSEYSKWRIKEYDADFTTRAKRQSDVSKQETKQVTIIRKDGRKIVVEIPVEVKVLDNIPIKDHDVIYEEKLEKEIEKQQEKKEKETEEKNKDKEIISVSIKEEKSEKKRKKKEVKSSEEEKISDQEIISIDSKSKNEKIIETKNDDKTEIIEKVSKNIEFDDLDDKLREKLSRLKSRKIIDEYEKQLKDIRYDLRRLVSDYNVLVKEEETAMTSRELDDILDRLNEVIVRVEKLKNRIQIDNLDKYDDNYIYTLIEDYLLEFKDKRVVSEIKDSPLYILISEKLDELDSRKDELKGKVSSKKDELAIKEEDFDLLKEKFYRVDKINKSLEEFQKEQERLLKDVQEKVANSVTESERVRVEIEAMSRQSRRLLRRLTLAMLYPGSRAARGMAIATSTYLRFARQLLAPTTVTRRYRVVEVVDYSRDIEYSIKSINDAIDLLKNSDKQIDSLIYQIKAEFGDYLGVFKEYDQLLSNLEKIKTDLHEKEYEMEKVKRAQERELEKNNAKVLTRGEFPM